jgi:hypothetical protein
LLTVREDPASAGWAETSNTSSVAPARGVYRGVVPRTESVTLNAAVNLAAYDEPIGGVAARAHVEHEASKLVGNLLARLAEDMDGAAGDGSPLPTQSAVSKTRAVAEAVALHVALTPRLKAAVFLEDAGSLAFVVQSLLTDRRLTIRLNSDGRQFEIVRTDEHMQTVRDVVGQVDGSASKELAEWVTRRG